MNCRPKVNMIRGKLNLTHTTIHQNLTNELRMKKKFEVFKLLENLGPKRNTFPIDLLKFYKHFRRTVLKCETKLESPTTILNNKTHLQNALEKYGSRKLIATDHQVTLGN